MLTYSYGFESANSLQSSLTVLGPPLSKFIHCNTHSLFTVFRVTFGTHTHTHTYTLYINVVVNNLTIYIYVYIYIFICIFNLKILSQ